MTKFNGTKDVTTIYLKDTANPAFELQKLNLNTFNGVFMLDEESIVVNKPDKDGNIQLFYGKINATDDQLQQVTNFTRRAFGFKFFSSSNTLYYGMTVADPVKRDDGAVFTLYNTSSVRNSNGYIKPNDDVLHIFSAKYSFNGENMTISNSTDVLAKFDKPFNVRSFDINREETWISFTAPGYSLKQLETGEMNNDLFLVPTNMTQQPFKVSYTEGGKSEVSSISIAPNGKKVAWSYKDASNENLILDIYVYDVNTRQSRSYFTGFDHILGEFEVVNDDYFLFTTTENDTTKLFTCDIKTGKITARTGDDIDVSITTLFANDTKLIVRTSNLLTPPELSIIDLKSWEMKPLTNANTEFMSQFELHKVERTSFKGWNKDTVTGWIHKPAGFDPSKKYPAIVMPHGGPNSAMLNAWWSGNVWNPAIYAAAGYFVIVTNFHGSNDQGRKFMESIYGQWGGNAYEDVMQGLDEALKQNSQIDSKRVCAAGASYGGYMTNWLSGKSPERFACFITHAGVYDLASTYLTSPFGKTDDDKEFVGLDANVSGIPDFSKNSPSTLLSKWSKPALVSHGGKDFTVPTDQGLAAFTALQYKNITSKFLYFPTEGHVVGDYANVAVQINEYLDWLNTHTKV